MDFKVNFRIDFKRGFGIDFYTRGAKEFNFRKVFFDR